MIVLLPEANPTEQFSDKKKCLGDVLNIVVPVDTRPI